MTVSRVVGERTGGAGDGARPTPRELPALVSEWPGWVREEYEEQAATLEYEARMAPGRAERAAEHIVRDKFRRGLL
jgi:hypothetical protein